MPNGKVEVELRLTMAKLKEDLAKASSAIKTSLGQTASTSAAKEADKETVAVDKSTQAVKRKTSAVKELQKAMLDAIRSGKQVGSPNVHIAGSGGTSGGINPVGWSAGAGGGLATQAPGLATATKQYSSPIGPQQVQTASIASMWRGMVNKELGPTGVTIAKAAAGMVAFRLAINQISWAVSFALVPIKAFVGFMSQAASQASSFYSKSLQSGGLGIGMTTQRSLIADAMGVGENEVYNYGAAFEALNAKFSGAAEIMARTNSVLTNTSWELKALNADWAALKATIAAELAPAFASLLADFRDLVRLATPFARAMAEQVKFVTTMIRLADVLSKLASGNFSGALLSFKNTVSGVKGAPLSSVATNRMPASAWEKMGLVIGSTPKNYAEQTARNTARIRDILASIHSNSVGGGGSIPRGNLTGLNPSYSQP